MAKILEDNQIEFSKEDLISAWDNSPTLINKDEKKFRMCFICKFFMIKDNFEYGDLSWVCEFIDLKHFNLDSSNIIAVHPGCREFRHKDDCTKIIQKIKAAQWSAAE
ncbi:hypothetical protein [Spiroplasma monobiae]|uniref:Uncharacterized protein n=1 Tax=Spiroplasma monobiae MQ-1 TaxID=1336748 RepID=A0A2K9LU72_SPISQ|nr:hypothetical protein [Spiroplasma monobiae]AUM62451.1 hypothetical protein SMONO_v1c02000 [Spiroplasma monobiae MQ-1]